MSPSRNIAEAHNLTTKDFVFGEGFEKGVVEIGQKVEFVCKDNPSMPNHPYHFHGRHLDDGFQFSLECLGNHTFSEQPSMWEKCNIECDLEPPILSNGGWISDYKKGKLYRVGENVWYGESLCYFLMTFDS